MRFDGITGVDTHIRQVGRYLEDPLAATRAVRRTRRGPRQRVVMAVHVWISMADEWAETRLKAVRARDQRTTSTREPESMR
jgi:hypothetical protein